MMMKCANALLILFVVIVPKTSCTESDCLYNRCEWKFTTFKHDHVPCLGTDGRALVRNVDCPDGNTFHICCKVLLREDIQKSRQKWFRAVTLIGDKLSRPCTKRILCEQSCLDGLRGSARSDYPQILDGDSQANRDYVHAYSEGESLACYNQTGKQEGKSNAHSDKECKVDCADKYHACAHELEQHFLVKVYYKSARHFHKLGLWLFSALHMSLDTFHEGMRRSVSVYQTIKKAFTDLYNRMVALESAFDNYLTRQEWINKGNQNRNRRSLDQKERKWLQFLVNYNRTDPQLVQTVHESLNYTQFSNAIRTIGHTLRSTDFGYGAWNGSTGNYAISSLLTMLILLIISFSFMSTIFEF